MHQKNPISSRVRHWCENLEFCNGPKESGRSSRVTAAYSTPLPDIDEMAGDGGGGGHGGREETGAGIATHQGLGDFVADCEFAAAKSDLIRRTMTAFIASSSGKVFASFKSVFLLTQP